MKRGRRNLVIAVSFVGLGVLPLPPGSAGAQTKIVVDGSTGTAPLVEALGKAFTAKSGVAVEIGKGLGTKARFEALAVGKIDIAMASHGLSMEEVARRGMVAQRIAMTPVLFAVQLSVPVADLQASQICAIYNGQVRNWKEVGGPDLVIAALARPDSEVDAEVVRAGVACFKALKLHESVTIAARAGDMARALANTNGAIGFTSATLVERSRGKIKAVALEGVTADEQNVVAGRHKLTRDAFLVVRKEATEPVRAFLAFVSSAEGAALIRANGALPAARP
jgi:phosphate transport system substrate-binding protein